MNRRLLGGKRGQAICLPPLINDTRGAVAVLVAIVMVVLLSFGALALDISNAMIARNELQNVADASALAGARQLGVIYQALPQGTPYTTYVLSNPSAVVNADFRMSIVDLKDGRTLNGLIAAKTDRTITLKTMTETVTLERSGIERIRDSALSLMPVCRSKSTGGR